MNRQEVQKSNRWESLGNRELTIGNNIVKSTLFRNNLYKIKHIHFKHTVQALLALYKPVWPPPQGRYGAFILSDILLMSKVVPSFPVPVSH